MDWALAGCPSMGRLGHNNYFWQLWEVGDHQHLVLWVFQSNLKQPKATTVVSTRRDSQMGRSYVVSVLALKRVEAFARVLPPVSLPFPFFVRLRIEATSI